MVEFKVFGLLLLGIVIAAADGGVIRFGQHVAGGVLFLHGLCFSAQGCQFTGDRAVQAVHVRGNVCLNVGQKLRCMGAVQCDNGVAHVYGGRCADVDKAHSRKGYGKQECGAPGEVETLRAGKLDALHEQTSRTGYHRRGWKEYGMKTFHRAEQTDACCNQKNALQDPELGLLPPADFFFVRHRIRLLSGCGWVVRLRPAAARKG